MIPVVSVAQMRELEAATAAAGVSYEQMMEGAGQALARVLAHAIEERGDRERRRRLLFLVGPGNNGGDALVAATRLPASSKRDLTAFLVRPRPAGDPLLAAAKEAGVQVIDGRTDKDLVRLRELLSNTDLAIDGILGIGARLPLPDDIAAVLDAVTQAQQDQLAGQGAVTYFSYEPGYRSDKPLQVVAVDCPTGVDCDSGECDPHTLCADWTITFGGVKYGLLRPPAMGLTGRLLVGDIGTPDEALDVITPLAHFSSARDVGRMLPERPSDAHKGSFGRAVIVAGSLNYPGAAALALEAACRSGAGLVTGAIPQPIYPILAAKLSDPTWLLLPSNLGAINEAALAVLRDEMGEAQALLLGPGLGRDEETGRFLRGLLTGEARTHRRGGIGFVGTANHEGETAARFLPDRLVLDADGLYHLRAIEEWWKYLPPQTVLTPHPGEFERLSGVGREEIAGRRIELAQEYAEKWGCVLLLKGAYSVIAAPGECAVVNPFANSALARGGTGDVLAGVIVGMMAQGLTARDAAVAGAYVHAFAATRRNFGRGDHALASDLVRIIADSMWAIRSTVCYQE